MVFENGLETMRQVANSGSFTGAARALGISGAAVSRQIKALESRLGLVLFNRTTRVVTLTESGEKLVESLNRSGDEVSTVIETLASGLDHPSGRLKINAPMSFGEKFLVDKITEYALTYPDVIVDITFDDRRVHLIEEGYDLVIRIGSLEDSGVIAKRLCDFPTHLFASPSFIKKYGLPKTPNDLKGLPAVIYSNAASGLTVKHKDNFGQDYTLELSPAIYANSIGMLLESTAKGIGYAALPELFCDAYLKEKRLVKLFSEYTLVPQIGVFALYPDRRYLPMKVRKFIDMLSLHLAQ